MKYWLMKSEPDVFSIDDLGSRPQQTERWDGVRNYQARNYLRTMKPGDEAFFYHSRCAKPGIAGIVKIVRAASPDPSAFDPRSPYYDPRGTPEKPVWFMVEVRLRKRFTRTISLSEIKAEPALRKMPLVQRGSRLSIMPVTAGEWNTILKMHKRTHPS
jgi:predicted RNA-binding protein with PUA-like domain